MHGSSLAPSLKGRGGCGTAAGSWIPIGCAGTRGLIAQTKGLHAPGDVVAFHLFCIGVKGAPMLFPILKVLITQ
uniref:Uncharacterized protein n=1 Tax=Manihot esculenta TaxID=3983 RepID=A0A2C9WP10_MANES